jgi:hypothetical protein
MFKVGGERRKPKRPEALPKIDDLPIYEKPKYPGMGRNVHPTEGAAVVRNSVRRFAKEVLGFEKPIIRKHFAYTGNVDFVVIDKAAPPDRQPCARFEIKSAGRYKTDVHASQAKRKRRAPRRAATYEINPKQHEIFKEQSKRGACGLFYVLVPRRGDSARSRPEHVGICTLPYIEDILGTKITKRRSVHREVGFECPDVKTWIRWTKEQK